MVKNIFEEGAWRGYLTPRLHAAGLGPLSSAALTGFIWAGWHIPYYLHFMGPEALRTYTSLPLPVFIGLAFAVLPMHALAYGELRLISGSVWPVWLLHNVANAISLPLFANGLIRLAPGALGPIFSPGTDGILYSVLMGLVGLALYRWRKQGASLVT
jgi:hypothetical protein